MKNNNQKKSVNKITFREYQEDYESIIKMYYGKEYTKYVPNDKELIQYYTAMLNPLQAFVEIIKIRTTA
jgi:hypothetical protein